MSSRAQLFFTTATGSRIPVDQADSFLKRLNGLMGKREGHYGLLLSPCNSIHTCFMRYCLDAVFLDSQNRIIAIRSGMKPFRATPVIRKAAKVLEFPSSLHAVDHLGEGMEIHFN
ncbi:MAG: DUF192 domain-containing protein [Clostridia bacterium]|nr:DUF192 domain-containing protein [Clostridia bacterium]